MMRGESGELGQQRGAEGGQVSMDSARREKLIELERGRQSEKLRERMATAREAAEIQARTEGGGVRGRIVLETRNYDTTILEWAEDVIKIRRELSASESELLTEHELRDWLSGAKRTLEIWQSARSDDFLRRLHAAGEAAAQTVRHLPFQSLIGRALDKLAAASKEMKLESDLGIKSGRPDPSIFVSVSGDNNVSAITIHSTAVEIGNLIGVVRVENPDLADAISSLTAAIESSKDLSQQDQAEALATIRDIAEDAPKPTGKIRRVLIMGLSTLLSKAADVAQIAAVAGPLIAHHYGVHWPV
jgi:hypothetical protein